MQIRWTITILVGLMTLYSTARGQALSETSALLQDPLARAKVIESNPAASRADSQVKALGLSKSNEEKVYHLSAQIFENLANQAGGDSEKLGAKIQDLLRDPSSLENSLTSDQKSQIHSLSNRTE